MEYKFRAEGIGDVVRFMAEVEPSSYTVYPCLYIPDVDVEFKAPTKNFRMLLNIARDLVDCHVIAQTLLPKDMYTGEREYDDKLAFYKFALNGDIGRRVIEVKALSAQSAFIKAKGQEICPDNAIELLSISK